MPIRVRFTGYEAELSDAGRWEVTETDLGLGEQLARRLNDEFPPGARPRSAGLAHYPYPILAQAEAAAEALDGEVLRVDLPPSEAPDSAVF